MKKLICLLVIIPVLVSGVFIPAASAAAPGVKEGAASLIIPGWGQYLNGDFENRSGRMKVGAMAVVEIAAIITTAVVGGVAGYPQIWIGVGLFLANHVWSAVDAFINAKSEPGVQLGTLAAQDKLNQ